MKETAMQRPDLRSWGSENDVEKMDAAGGGGVGKRAEAEVRMEGRSAAGGECGGGEAEKNDWGLGFPRRRHSFYTRRFWSRASHEIRPVQGPKVFEPVYFQKAKWPNISLLGRIFLEVITALIPSVTCSCL